MKSKKKVIGISVGCVCVLAVVALAVILLVSRCGKEEDKGVVKASPVTYVVKYNSHGGAPVKDGKYTPGEKFVLPTPASGSDPKMYGYSFTSWSYDADGKDTATVPLDEDKAVNGVITLHAGWTNVHTVYFDTRTMESIEPRQYRFGDRIPVADLPRATDRVVGGTPVPYVCWVNASTGQAITEDLRMEGTDMYLYAKYDTGVTSKFELLDDGTYRPLVTGAQTTFRDWKLQDGQVYSLDMILPADPADFNGDAGPVFAATGFDEQSSTFTQHDYVWASVLRSHDPNGTSLDVLYPKVHYRGALRFWGNSQKDAETNTNLSSLAFYMLPNQTFKGSPYERKMSAYLNGGRTNKETSFTYTIRRSGNAWYIGIDGIEYFTVEVDSPILPTPVKPDEGGTLSLNSRYANGVLVGFRSNTMNIRFANVTLKDAKTLKQNPANRHTVYFDTKTSQKVNPRACYPGETVVLPQQPPRNVQGKNYEFLYWVNESTGLPVQSNFKMPTCDVHLFAQYDTGTTSRFELLDDGTYRPTVTGTGAQTTYFDWKLNDWQIFSVDMILPEDPSKFNGDAGPVFAATGFNEKSSAFMDDYVWASVLRSHDPNGTSLDTTYPGRGYRGSLRIWGHPQNAQTSAGLSSLAFYMVLPSNANTALKDTRYAAKMTKYLAGQMRGTEPKITFTVRKVGNTWYLKADDAEFVLEVGKPVTPKPKSPDEGGTLLLNNRYKDGLLVGFRSNTMNVRFGNISITDVNQDDYKSTITFETAAKDEIPAQKYMTGETVSSADLPRPKAQTVKEKSYDFLYWVDKETGRKVPDNFAITKDMTLVAHYDIGTTSAFILTDEGFYKPTGMGTNALAESTLFDWQLTDGKIFSVDMIFPEDPKDFDGAADSGPVFAATGFDEAGMTFTTKSDKFLWMGIIRMTLADNLETSKGSVRIWQIVNGTATSLGNYLIGNGGALGGTAYEKKIMKYKEGGASLEDRTFRFSFRRAGNIWYIGIDGREYFAVEAGKSISPSLGATAGTVTDNALSEGKLVGFRTSSKNICFANPGLKEAKDVEPDPANYRTVYFRTNIPSKVDAVKLIPGESLGADKLSGLGGRLTLKVGETECPFIAWAYDGTNGKVSDGINVTVETGDIHIHAVYDITRVTGDTGVNAKFTLQEDGSYKPIGEGNLFESLYSTADDFTDGKVYSVDMIMPENPGDFDGAVDTGPVFATGFDSGGSTFNGYQYLWIGIIRYTVPETSANLRGSIRIWGFIDGDSAVKNLGNYALTGSALKGSRYSEKMGAYLAGDMRGEEVTFTFSVRRTGNVWNISIDGEQLFTVETGKKLAAANGGEPDGSDLKNREYLISSQYATATQVGFKASSKNVRFANVRIDDAPAAMRAGLIRPSFADNAFARRLIFLPVDPDDVIKESFSPVRTNAKVETSGVRTVLLPAKALLARIKAIFRAGF